MSLAAQIRHNGDAPEKSEVAVSSLTGPMDERLRFVAKLLEGESMGEVCREFGISRKTGYKIFRRYKESKEMVFVQEGTASDQEKQVLAN